MSRYNQPIVPMQKVLNDKPFDVTWVYWETDIFFTYGTSSIVIRTHDKSLSNYKAEFWSNDESVDIPIGTYSVSGNYELIVGTVGYISHVLKDSILMEVDDEPTIPNDGEFYIEWISEVNKLVPYPKDITPGGYTVGAKYIDLKERIVSGTYLLSDKNEILTDGYGNRLTFR